MTKNDDWYGDADVSANIDPAKANTFTVTLKAPDAWVTIAHDGTITYGPGYTPDAAAKVFWDAVGLERKCRKDWN